MLILNLDGNPIIESEVKLDSMNESKINKKLKLTLNKKTS